MKIKAFKNYGVLANEKRNVYTVGAPHSTAVAWDEIQIEIPEGFTASENEMGNLLIDTPDGKTYLASEMLGQQNGRPALIWYDGTSHFVYCDYEEV